MTLQPPLTVYCLNLDSNPERMAATRRAFARVEGIDLQRVPGVLGSSLSEEDVARLIKGSFLAQLGTLGCFLAHAAAWRRIAGSDQPAVIIEDDVKPIGFERLFTVEFGTALDLIFLNDRMANRRDGKGRLRLLPARTILPHKAKLPYHKGGVGGDGYLVTPAGARKMLQAVEADGMGGHVDWRLLRYALRRADVDDNQEIAGTWLTQHALRDKGLRWDVIRARRLTSALIVHRPGSASERRQFQPDPVADAAVPPIDVPCAPRPISSSAATRG